MTSIGRPGGGGARECAAVVAPGLRPVPRAAASCTPAPRNSARLRAAERYAQSMPHGAEGAPRRESPQRRNYPACHAR